MLEDQLSRCRIEVQASLTPADWLVLQEAIERLRMMQVADHALRVGDALPEFTLPDTDGLMVSSEALLDRGPLAVVFIRGTWCPYCSATLEALDRARPAIEQLGGSLVAISPMSADELVRAASARGLGLRLLSDADASYARVCGVQYEMSDAHTEMFSRFGLDIAALNAGSGWQLPVPASYVAGADGVIAFAFADPDWTRRAEPDELVAAVERLAQAAEPTG
jgi:peroxiredoxin